MMIQKLEKKYARDVATLLNEYLPFQPETENTVLAAGGVQIICTNAKNEVVGYIAGYTTNIKEDFPFPIEQLEMKLNGQRSYFTSHFVVHPDYRKQGIGSKLIEAYERYVFQQVDLIIVVGWVQSDIGQWAAEKAFRKFNYQPTTYIPRYFEYYQVYCPSCNGNCYCDAHIHVKERSN